MKRVAKISLLLVVPLMAAGVVVWKASAARPLPPVAECSELMRDPLPTGFYPSPVLFSNPDDCSIYYMCTSTGLIEYKCPEGLLFNPELQTCDWPINEPCKQSPNQYNYTDRLVTKMVWRDVLFWNGELKKMVPVKMEVREYELCCKLGGYDQCYGYAYCSDMEAKGWEYDRNQPH